MLALILAGAVAYPAVDTDPRFELWGVVEMLAGAENKYDGFFLHSLPYDREARERFAPFRKHPVVAAYKEMAGRGMKPQFFHDFLMTLSPPPELEPQEPFYHGRVPQAGGAEAVETLRLLLADFARVSDFASFYRDTEKERRAWIKDVEAQSRKLEIVEKLDAYTGYKTDIGYKVILSPWIEPSLTGTWIKDNVIINTYGPEEFEGRTQWRLYTKRGQLWRTIAFEQLKPVEKDQRLAARASESAFEPLRGRCAATWPECVRRQVSFAVGARLLEFNGDLDAAHEWPIKYARLGMPHIGVLVEALKEYEAHRAQYPTLTEFYPKLLAAVERAGAVRIPFGGGVADALEDPEVLVVTGTPWGNAWLKANWAKLHLPLTLEPGKLSFNQRFNQLSMPPVTGKARLVTVAVHPDDVSRPVLIYTGTDEDEARSAAGAYKGAADYAVLVGTATVKLGSYERSRIPWRLK